MPPTSANVTSSSGRWTANSLLAPPVAPPRRPVSGFAGWLRRGEARLKRGSSRGSSGPAVRAPASTCGVGSAERSTQRPLRSSYSIVRVHAPPAPIIASSSPPNGRPSNGDASEAPSRALRSSSRRCCSSSMRRRRAARPIALATEKKMNSMKSRNRSASIAAVVPAPPRLDPRGLPPTKGRRVLGVARRVSTFADDAIAALRLGGVEGHVGAPDRVGGIRAVAARALRDADADRHDARRGVGVGKPEVPHGVTHAVGDDQSAVERLLCEEDEELLAAVAVDGVAAAALAAEGVGDGAQHAVAGLVAVTIVERLEVIDVAEQHAVGVAVADATGVETDQILLQAKAVPQPGEGVVAGLFDERGIEQLKLALDPAALRDVAEHQQRAHRSAALADRGRGVLDREACPVLAPEDLVTHGARYAALQGIHARALVGRIRAAVAARVVDQVMLAPTERLLERVAGHRRGGG